MSVPGMNRLSILKTAGFINGSYVTVSHMSNANAYRYQHRERCFLFILPEFGGKLKMLQCRIARLEYCIETRLTVNDNNMGCEKISVERKKRKSC